MCGCGLDVGHLLVSFLDPWFLDEMGLGQHNIKNEKEAMRLGLRIIIKRAVRGPELHSCSLDGGVV